MDAHGPNLCLVTRIRVSRISTLIGTIYAYYRVRQRAKVVSGLVDNAFILRWPRTIIFISLWQDEQAMAEFAAAVPGHASLVHRLRRDDADVWSGLYQITKVSRASKAWDVDAEPVHDRAVERV